MDMSSTPSTARSKRARASRTPGDQASTPRATTGPVLSADQRNALIAERAYLRAEQRGFQGGDPVSDWLDSEKEVDALLSRHAD
jgi:DUF2934 family protein